MGRIGNFFRNVGGKIKRGAQWVGRKIKEHPILTAGALAAGAGAIAAGRGIAKGVTWAREHPELVQHYKDFHKTAQQGAEYRKYLKPSYDPNQFGGGNLN
jgi:hypothetical protein